MVVGFGLSEQLVLFFGFILIGTLAGAIMLRAAVTLFNKIAGGADSPCATDEPPFRNAARIIFVVSLLNALVRFLVGLFVGDIAEVMGISGQIAGLAVNLIFVPIAFLIMASMFAAMLPTTFGCGILITLCYLLIATIVVALLTLVVFLASLLF